MSDDDDDTFFIIILPVTIVIFVSIFTYLFVGYMRLKKHLLNSGQVISALPFLILPDEQPEIRSPDGQLPPPAYNTIENEYENGDNSNNSNNNIHGVLNYNHPSLSDFSLGTNVNARRERHRSRSRPGRQQDNANARAVSGGMLVTHAELQQNGPPSTEMMLERPPPIYSIENATEVTISSGRNGRRNRRKDTMTNERIPMSDIAPPPYTLASEVPAN